MSDIVGAQGAGCGVGGVGMCGRAEGWQRGVEHKGDEVGEEIRARSCRALYPVLGHLDSVLWTVAS